MKKLLFAITLLCAMSGLTSMGHAQEVLLDDVETSVEPEWAKIRIRFTKPINYERHFPQEHGQLLKIFFTINLLDTQDVSLRREIRQVSATPVLPATKITFEPPVALNLLHDPWSLSLQFDRDVTYNVRPGDDNRSIVVYLPVVPAGTGSANVPKQIPETKKTPVK